MTKIEQEIKKYIDALVKEQCILVFGFPITISWEIK